MDTTIYNYYIIMFIVMIVIGILFDPMNVLVYRLSDLQLSLTSFYGGLLMASNMIWAHEIIHYLSMNHFNTTAFIIGISLSILATILLRQQFLISDRQWLKGMITHHSTALTLSNIIYEKTDNIKLKQLAKNIIDLQEKEIQLMKSML